MLLNLLWVINNHVCFEIEFRSIEGDVLALLHRILKVFLHLIFKVASNWMMVEILPLYSFTRINCEHPLYHILRNLGNAIYISWKPQRFVLYVIHEFYHICSFIRWAKSQYGYVPKSIS